ncbi:MAG: signal peptide peptidase SppA [Anaerohalosphaeraceae bacterium]|nr:signal peptide peptidase SppA [Anaerohalosphaeraceae bacterium]
MTTEYNGYDLSESNQGPQGQTLPAKKQRGGLWKVLFTILFVLSILANFFMLIIVIFAIAIFSSSSHDSFLEKSITDGPSNKKIAVIGIEGIIGNEMSREFARQIKMAEEDDAVKALIIHTVTPGGGISASDQIHNKIMKFREQTGKPVIAFMQTIAASGGYYTSAACDKIIAEPTAITGSIGVIMGHFELKELFEEKLGIKSVVVKSSQKKNWPTTFEPVTEEQLAYLSDKLIVPAYERFVNIVADGRGNLDYSQVKNLADGSIYNATEAFDNGLVDEIGYFDDAVELAKSLAGIENARIVEYTKPFSMESIFGAGALVNFDIDSIYEMATPQLMYIWDAGLNF